MVPQEVNVTEQEKQKAIEDLQCKVNGAVSSLVSLHKVAKDLGTLDLFPAFDDVVVKMAMDSYRELQKLRGY